jgi:hypothetical protein
MMQPDFWSAVGSVGAFFVIALSAIVALVQLRHIRTGNQLQALLSVERDFQDPGMQNALRYCQAQLPQRMEDAAYRAALAHVGFIDTREHPEMIVCNWFNQMGALVKNDMVSEDAFLDIFGRLVDYYWRILEPAVAVLRRNRPGQYESFEYLAMRSQKWRARHRSGLYPENEQRLPVTDPWAAIDVEDAR